MDELIRMVEEKVEPDLHLKKWIRLNMEDTKFTIPGNIMIINDSNSKEDVG